MAEQTNSGKGRGSNCEDNRCAQNAQPHFCLLRHHNCYLCPFRSSVLLPFKIWEGDGGGNIRLCLPALFCISTDIYSTFIISDKQKPLYPISYAPPNQHKYRSLKHSSHLIEQIRNNQTECLASRNSYPLFPTHPHRHKKRTLLSKQSVLIKTENETSL